MLKIQKLDLLIAIYIFCICVAELMGGKVFKIGDFPWGPLNASVAIFVIPVIFSVNDIITEVYGKERTRSIIRSGLVVIFLILVFSLLATALPPSVRSASSESAYDLIFSTSARIAAASLTAFTIAEFLDVLVFIRIRQKLGKTKLWLRNNLSNFISQFVDTTTFMFLAFYAFDKSFANNFDFLWRLILPYFLLKCFMSVIETPFVYVGVKWLRGEKK